MAVALLGGFSNCVCCVEKDKERHEYCKKKQAGCCAVKKSDKEDPTTTETASTTQKH
jgi:hypothetical protein